MPSSTGSPGLSSMTTTALAPNRTHSGPAGCWCAEPPQPCRSMSRKTSTSSRPGSTSSSARRLRWWANTDRSLSRRADGRASAAPELFLFCRFANLCACKGEGRNHRMVAESEDVHMHELSLPADLVAHVTERAGRPHPFDVIGPTKTAFVVVDMQNYFM